MKFYALLLFVFIFPVSLLSQKKKEIKKAHEDVIRCVTYSPDGTNILTSDAGNLLKIWDASTKKRKYKIETPSKNNRQAIYNKAGDKIYTCSKEITVFNALSRKAIKSLARSETNIYAIALTKCENYIISANWDKKISIWNLETDSLLQVLEIHQKPVLSVSYSPTENKFLTSSSDKTIALWKFDNGKAELIKHWQAHDNDVTKVLFAPDGKSFLSASGDETIKRWNTETLELLHVYRGHSTSVTTLAFSPKGKTFLSGALDAKVLWWNTESGYRIADIKGHTAFINSVAFSPKGNQITTADYNLTLRIWNTYDLINEKDSNTIRYTQQIHRNRINQITVALREDIFAGVGKDSLLIIWGLKSALPIHTIRAHRADITSVAISPDSELTATGAKDFAIKLWNSRTGKLVKTIEKHTDWIEHLDFSPDGKKLISSSWDKTVRVWDIRSGKAEQVIENENWLKQAGFISDDTIFYASDNDYLIHLHSLSAKKEIAQLSAHRNNIRSIALSADKKLLASAANDSSFVVWNLSTKEKLFQLRTEKTRYIYDCAFANKGKTLITASSDGYLRFFDIEKRQYTGEKKITTTPLSALAVAEKENLIICGGWDKFLNVLQIPKLNKKE